MPFDLQAAWSLSLEVFGFASVAAMVACYALDARAPRYRLLFSLACLSSATYAALIGSWPFAGVEALWGALAFQAWRQTRANGAHRCAGRACSTADAAPPRNSSVARPTGTEFASLVERRAPPRAGGS